jgi:hypothetical protein
MYFSESGVSASPLRWRCDLLRRKRQTMKMQQPHNDPAELADEMAWKLAEDYLCRYYGYPVGGDAVTSLQLVVKMAILGWSDARLARLNRNRGEPCICGHDYEQHMPYPANCLVHGCECQCFKEASG